MDDVMVNDNRNSISQATRDSNKCNECAFELSDRKYIKNHKVKIHSSGQFIVSISLSGVIYIKTC